MKISELRALSQEELIVQIQECNQQLFQIRLQLSMQQLNNTAEIGRLKNQLAQMKMLLNQAEKVSA